MELFFIFFSVAGNILLGYRLFCVSNECADMTYNIKKLQMDRDYLTRQNVLYVEQNVDLLKRLNKPGHSVLLTEDPEEREIIRASRSRQKSNNEAAKSRAYTPSTPAKRSDESSYVPAAATGFDYSSSSSSCSGSGSSDSGGGSCGGGD